MNEKIIELLYHSVYVLLGTLKDVLPIIGVILFFQLVIIRKKVDNPGRLIYGFCLVIVGLSIFMIGLEKGLFPLGETMSRQLTNFHFLAKGDNLLLEEIENTGNVYPLLYFWTYIFGFFIGFSTTIAEPALLAVALKANEVTVGAISSWGASPCSGIWSSNRYFSRLLQDSYRFTSSLVYCCRIHNCCLPDILCPKNDYFASL